MKDDCETVIQLRSEIHPSDDLTPRETAVLRKCQYEQRDWRSTFNRRGQRESYTPRYARSSTRRTEPMLSQSRGSEELSSYGSPKKTSWRPSFGRFELV